MAEEEFQESEVVFPDCGADLDGYCDFREMRNGNAATNCGRNSNRKKKKKKKKQRQVTNSLPVNIPGGGIFGYAAGDSDDFEEELEIVPPHVIIGRRIAGKMAFSVCTGNGRTLKGRDLSQVRNTILRMTGFLET